jgi:hypothetical protein
MVLILNIAQIIMIITYDSSKPDIMLVPQLGGRLGIEHDMGGYSAVGFPAISFGAIQLVAGTKHTRPRQIENAFISNIN